MSKKKEIFDKLETIKNILYALSEDHRDLRTLLIDGNAPREIQNEPGELEVLRAFREIQNEPGELEVLRQFKQDNICAHNIAPEGEKPVMVSGSQEAIERLLNLLHAYEDTIRKRNKDREVLNTIRGLYPIMDIEELVIEIRDSKEFMDHIRMPDPECLEDNLPKGTTSSTEEKSNL